MAELRQVPQLTKKTAAERGPLDPDGLTVALTWDRIQQPDPLDQVVTSVTKGGPGSGNFAHAGRPGERGGSAPGGGSAAGKAAKATMRYIERDPDRETIQRWTSQIEKWDPNGGRRGIGYMALNEIERQGAAALVLEVGDELKAISALHPPRLERDILGGLLGEEPKIRGTIVSAPFGATKERGYGRRMMREIAKITADGGWALSYNATDLSLGFHKKIGLIKPGSKEKGVYMEASQLKEWLSTGTYKASLEEEAALAEPENGIFFIPELPAEKGGATSGNWGHAGRPGQRGGSMPGGGHGRIGIKPGHKQGEKVALTARQRKRMARGAKYKAPDAYDPEGKKVTTRGDYFRDCKTGAYNQMCGAEKRARDAAEKAQTDLHERIRKEGGARRQDDPAMVREDVLAVDKKYNRIEGQRRRRLRESWYERAEAENEYWASMDKTVEITESGEKRESYLPPPIEDEERRAAWIKADARYIKSQETAWRASNRLEATLAERDEKIRDIISVGTGGYDIELEPAAWPEPGSGSDPATAKDRTDKGVAFINDLTHPDMEGDSYVFRYQENPESFGGGKLVIPPPYARGARVEWTLSPAGRASCNGNTILLAPSDGIPTVVHELGHYLEHTSLQVHQNAVGFFLHRVGTEAPRKLNDIYKYGGFRENEIAITDKFIDSYMGKVYTWSKTGGVKLGNIRSTEIVSMGVQFLYKDPLRLAKEDPEYFEFMITTMNGDKWKAPGE